MENGAAEKDQEQKPVEENQTEEQPGWFQDFVDNYDVDSPKQGEILSGTILDISDNSILLDVGLKRDAIITSQDLDKVDDEITQELSEGDEVYVSVIRTPIGDDDLLVSLSRGLAYKHWIKAEEYLDSDEILELKIIDKNRGGLLVSFESLRGFVPNSHIPSLRRGTPNQKANEIKGEMIGDVLPVKVIEVDRQQRRLVFSARIAQKKKREQRLQELEEGMTIKSRVVNVVDFGVFVDLDGVDGLVHKSEIAWDRVYDPSKYFNVGDEIEVKVVEIDVERERVSLSRKALLPNPWDELAEKYQDGDLVEGKVVSVLDFGAFIELPEGLQGLVHVSEIGYANMGDPRSVVQKGDQVLVRVLNVEPDRERVSLSMRRVPVDKQMEWMMEQESEEESEAESGIEDDQFESPADEDQSSDGDQVEEAEQEDVEEDDEDGTKDVDDDADDEDQELEPADEAVEDEDGGKEDEDEDAAEEDDDAEDQKVENDTAEDEDGGGDQEQDEGEDSADEAEDADIEDEQSDDEDDADEDDDEDGAEEDDEGEEEVEEDDEEDEKED